MFEKRATKLIFKFNSNGNNILRFDSAKFEATKLMLLKIINIFQFTELYMKKISPQVKQRIIYKCLLRSISGISITSLF